MASGSLRAGQGGLILENRRKSDSRHEALADELTAVGKATRASHAAMLALAERMEHLSAAMGVPRLESGDHSRLTNGHGANGGVSPRRGASPRSPQDERFQAAFRNFRAR